MDKKTNIGKERLNELLRDFQMSAAELCRRTGIPTSSMSRYLTGQSVPKQDSLKKIADALNVNPAWLMGYDINKEPEFDYWLEAERVLVEIEGLTPANIEKVKAFARKLKEIQDKEKELEELEENA